jgi:hypothetical protein
MMQSLHGGSGSGFGHISLPIGGVPPIHYLATQSAPLAPVPEQSASRAVHIASLLPHTVGEAVEIIFKLSAMHFCDIFLI